MQVFEILYLNLQKLIWSPRICGHQLMISNDDGTQQIPVPADDSFLYGERPQTSLLEDVEEFGAFDSQG